MDYHVALYIRLSKEDETEGPSQSVTNQKSLLNEFVQQHRLSVYDTYIDDGWSGTSFDRPDFQRMIGDIEAKKVNMVITKDLSRLGRDYIMTGHYMERYFPEKRVRYISLLDGIDTGVESTANDITPFRAIMNDMYAKDISKKIKSVKRDKQRKGQFIGGKPMYGYKMHPTEKNKIVIDEKVAPVVTVVCNFTKPAAGQPALLSADEANTLFHEFGHALHNLFKDVHYYGVASVPRDFVELPSQIDEHWAFEPEVLNVYAKHYQTGEVIPAGLVEKMDKSGKYGQGFATAEYLAASLLDMDYHVLKEIPDDMDVMQFEAETLGKRGLLKQIPSRYRTTYFNHTMGGGYTAGYYSYIWAEVLDCDAYEAYKETGDIFNQEVAGKFRKYILTPGCIDDAMDMYVNFRGKEPGIDPLLKNRGLK